MSKSNTNTNVIDEIVVADPPPRRRNGGARVGKWQKRLSQIEAEHPNKFCVFAEGVKSAAYFYALSAKHDNVELTTRQAEDGTFDVYVKVNV